MKIPLASTVLLSARNTVERKQADLTKFMRAYAEAIHYFLTNKEGTIQIVAKYTKVEDREVNGHAIESEWAAVERTLQVDPKGIELILALMSKSMPQGPAVKTEEFYDSRFTNELRDSGFLKRLVGRQAMTRRDAANSAAIQLVSRRSWLQVHCAFVAGRFGKFTAATRRIHSFGVITMIAGALGLFAPSSVPAADKLIGIHSARVLSQSMPWVAREAGLFKKYNLDFDLVFIASSPSVTAAMLSGEAEISLGGGEGPIRAYVQDASDFVFVSGFEIC